MKVEEGFDFDSKIISLISVYVLCQCDRTVSLLISKYYVVFVLFIVRILLASL
jgi:hypothetical protein